MAPSRPSYSSDLVLLSILAFCLVIARACIQSVTIDEADAFMSFATRDSSLIWYPVAQNHLLYTLLARLSWNIFGFNQVAMRLPALLGAAIYLTASIHICSRFAGRIFRLAVFICLTLNPFVQDYLVAARGYGLAAAFLLSAIALFWGSLDGASDAAPLPPWRLALVSVLLALSSAANFSFGIVDIVAAIVFLILVLVDRNIPRRQILRAVLWGTLPGLVTGLFLCLSVLIGWHKGEFVFGAHSLHDMRASIFSNMFPPPNPEIVNPRLYRIWTRFRLPLCVAAVLLGCVHMTAIALIRRIRDAVELRAAVRIATALTIVLVFTVALHWITFRAFGIYLPKARTALFFAPVLTLILAVGTDILRREPRLRGFAVPGMVVLAACALYYLSAFRLHYFDEWRFNEDTKTLYWVMDDAERRCGIHEFSTEWRYASVLNFYRRQYGNRTMKPFTGEFAGTYPKDKNAYVLFRPESESFIKENKLPIWYDNAETGALVAVRACPAKGM